MGALGYKQLAAHLRAELDLDEAVRQSGANQVLQAMKASRFKGDGVLVPRPAAV